MLKRYLIAVLLLLIAVPVSAVPPRFFPVDGAVQQESPGRGDDLGRIRAWRTFLDRADRAFFAARMDTEPVDAKTAEADERIEELEAAAKNSEPDANGRSDITGDVAFLERAYRAFAAARMNTTDVQKWLQEAREKS